MAQESSKPVLKVRLEFDKRKYKSADGQHLVFSLTNDSSKTMSVLKWYTPFEDLKSNIFDVKITGYQARYVGRTYKRGLPTAEDYLILNPGQTITKRVNFTDAYDIAHAGQYNVNYKSELLLAGPEEPDRMMKTFMAPMPKIAQFSVEAKATSFTLEEGRKPKQVGGVQLEAMKKLSFAVDNKPVFNNCSAEQQAIIKKALAEAVKMAQEASQTLNNAPTAARLKAKRYKEWFGRYSTAFYDRITTHLGKINYTLANKQITFTGNWEEECYAFVYPDRPYEIHLCKLFLEAPMTGADSQAGTIVHETSHFYVVAGTDDYVYGRPLCRKLARYPDKATMNADSHEFFGENTPPLTM